MKRRRIIFFCALVLMAAGGVALWPRGPKEPVYQGKKLTQWIEEANSYSDPARKETAHAAILAIGTNAIPFLKSDFTASGSRHVERLKEWVSHKTGWNLKFEVRNQRLTTAMLGFYLLGTNASPALPFLAGHLRDSQRNFAAAWAMRGCGAYAVPYLIEGSRSTNNQERFFSVQILTTLVRPSEPARTRLLQMLRHEDPEVRRTVVMSFRDGRVFPDFFVPLLIEGLSDPDAQVQREASSSLTLIKGTASNAIPALIRMMNDTNQNRFLWASNALYELDPAALPK